MSEYKSLTNTILNALNERNSIEVVHRPAAEKEREDIKLVARPGDPAPDEKEQLLTKTMELKDKIDEAGCSACVDKTLPGERDDPPTVKKGADKAGQHRKLAIHHLVNALHEPDPVRARQLFRKSAQHDRAACVANNLSMKREQEELEEGVKNKISSYDAKKMLDQHNAHGDYHALDSSTVDKLTDEAKKVGYRKGKSAPGSTTRMFHSFLTKHAAKYKRSDEALYRDKLNNPGYRKEELELEEGSNWKFKGTASTYNRDSKEWKQDHMDIDVKAKDSHKANDMALKKLVNKYPDHKEHSVELQKEGVGEDKHGVGTNKGLTDTDAAKLKSVGTSKKKTEVDVNPTLGMRPMNKEDVQLDERSMDDEGRDFHRGEMEHHFKVWQTAASDRRQSGPFGAATYHKKKYEEHKKEWEKLNKRPVYEGHKNADGEWKDNGSFQYDYDKISKETGHSVDDIKGRGVSWARNNPKGKGAPHIGMRSTNPRLKNEETEQLEEGKNYRKGDAPETDEEMYKHIDRKRKENLKSIDRGFKQTMKSWPYSNKSAQDVKEETKQLDELSRNTLSNYQVKAMYDDKPSKRNDCPTGVCPMPGNTPEGKELFDRPKGLGSHPRGKGIKQAGMRLQGKFDTKDGTQKYKMEDVLSPEEMARIDEIDKLEEDRRAKRLAKNQATREANKKRLDDIEKNPPSWKGKMGTYSMDGIKADKKAANFGKVKKGSMGVRDSKG